MSLGMCEKMLQALQVIDKYHSLLPIADFACPWLSICI
jgi:hypothetical protein